LDVRVYVIFMGTLQSAGNLMMYLAMNDFINDKTVTFGSGSMANSDVWTSVTKDPVMVNKVYTYMDMYITSIYIYGYVYLCVFMYIYIYVHIHTYM
jgi:hypothetical protein